MVQLNGLKVQCDREGTTLIRDPRGTTGEDWDPCNTSVAELERTGVTEHRI